MTRHSKNANSLGIFTSREAGVMTKRNQTQRLGRDSLAAFDACSLCLAVVHGEVKEFGGRLYCLACLVEWLVNAKQSVATAQVAAADQEAKRVQSQRSKAEQEEGRRIEAFIASNTALASKAPVVDTRKVEMSTAYILNLTNPLAGTSPVPSIAPTPKEPLMLHGTKFTALKRCNPVHFNPDKSCACCTKAFLNGMPLVLCVPCGHVFCAVCTNLIKQSCHTCKTLTSHFH